MSIVITRPCGCIINTRDIIDLELIYCPTHAAAPLLLEALKDMLLLIAQHGSPVMKAHATRIMEAHAALSVAEPKDALLNELKETK